MMRGRCFYCMGSMGSVAPVAVGISLARPTIRVLALEGDGSLLMNLGTLATLRRYGSSHIRLIIFDNGCYESTGGQVCQPEGFELERVCSSAGLATSVASTEGQIVDFLADAEARVLVVKTALGGRPARILQSPAAIASAFTRELEVCGGSRARPPGDGRFDRG
jgi:TPP-dependent trihydroxycyclohexane-1,2-dione (THcHDO) dehydratase